MFPEMHRLRRAEKSLRRQMLITQAIVIAIICGVCTFCVIVDRQSWPLVGFVAAIWLSSGIPRDLRQRFRIMLREKHARVVTELFPQTQQTTLLYDENWEPIGYRGFPGVPIFTAEQLREAGEAYRNKRDQIPDHILKRGLPDRPSPQEQQARRLLWSMLDPQQRAQYAVGHKFKVPLTKGRFTFRTATIGDGYVRWPDGVQQCVHPEGGRALHGPLPATDSVIAQLIHLRNDPHTLFRMRD